MRCIIAGGRDFTDEDLLEKELNLLRERITEVVSGGASGADALGEAWAYEHYIPCKVFPADWDKHGRSAGPTRNVEMAEYADMCVVFWDGKSKGSKHMIHTALDKQLLTVVVPYGDVK